MIPLKAVVHGMSIDNHRDRRVIVEVGPPGRDGVDVLLVDPYGALYWANGNGYEVCGTITNGNYRDWLDPADVGDFPGRTR